MERNLDLEAQGIFPEGDDIMVAEEKPIEEKVRYEIVQTNSGQIFIFRNGLKPEGNKAEDVYMLRAAPSKEGAVMGLNRLDQATLMESVDGLVRFSESNIDIRYFIKNDCEIVKQIPEVDKQIQAHKSGLILPGKELIK